MSIRNQDGTIDIKEPNGTHDALATIRAAQNVDEPVGASTYAMNNVSANLFLLLFAPVHWLAIFVNYFFRAVRYASASRNRRVCSCFSRRSLSSKDESNVESYGRGNGCHLTTESLFGCQRNVRKTGRSEICRHAQDFDEECQIDVPSVAGREYHRRRRKHVFCDREFVRYRRPSRRTFTDACSVAGRRLQVGCVFYSKVTIIIILSIIIIFRVVSYVFTCFKCAAYEFSRKFPGYTADNLSEKGIHEVTARRFCLVAADHPLIHAIQENAHRLQAGELSMMYVIFGPVVAFWLIPHFSVLTIIVCVCFFLVACRRPEGLVKASLNIIRTSIWNTGRTCILHNLLFLVFCRVFAVISSLLLFHCY